MVQRSRIAGTLLSLALVVGSAAADEDPLSLVPAKMPLVIQVRGVKASRARITAMLQHMGPELADAASESLDSLAETLSGGRDRPGLAEDGRVLVLVPKLPQQFDSSPPLIFLYPITNYDAFRDSLANPEGDGGLQVQHDPAGFDALSRKRKEVDVAATTKARETNPSAPTVYKEIKNSTYLIQLPKYAAVVPDEATARLLLDRSRPLSGILPAHLAEAMLDSDVGVYLDLDQVRKAYEARFRQARMLIQFGMIVAQNQQSAMLGPELAKASMEAARKAIDAFAQLGGDSERLVLGGQFDPAGLALGIRVGVKPGSESAKVLGPVKVEHSEWLERMPRGQQAYLSLTLNPQLMTGFSKMGLDMMRNFAGVSKEQMARMAEEQTKAGMREVVMASTQHRGMHGVQIARYDHPKIAAEAQLQSAKLLNSKGGLGSMGLPLKSVEIQPNAGQTHGIAFTRMELVWDFEKLAKRPNGKLLAEQFRGSVGERSVQWIGATNEVLLSVMAESWEEARALIEDVLERKNTVGSQAEFRSTRKRLPHEASLVAVVDLPAALAASLEQIQAVLQQQQAKGGPAAPKAKGAGPKQSLSPAYVGVAVGVRETQLDFDLWLSGDVVRAFNAQLPSVLEAIPGAK